MILQRIKLILFCLIPTIGLGQISVGNTQLDQVIADYFVGNGVFISNMTFNNFPFDSSYSQIGYFSSDSGAFPFSNGIIMCTGNIDVAIGPNDATSATNNSGVVGPMDDPDLNSISTATMYNEAILEFDFVPAGDSVFFEYILASEEYPEYAPSTFNDAFGFFISGPGISGPYSNSSENIAMLPLTTPIPVTINNVNPTTNASYYYNNAGDTEIQFDGRTIVLQARAAVICGETYHIKLAIGDAGDQSFDSGIFLKGSSLVSNGIGLNLNSDQSFAFSGTTIYEGCDSLEIDLSIPFWAIGTNQDILINTSGNALLDQDYYISDTLVSLTSGDSLIPIYVYALVDSFLEVNDSLILTFNLITPCGDTIQIEKIIHISDYIPQVLTVNDTIISCPNELVYLQANVSNGLFNDITWGSLGSGSSILYNATTDTSIIVQCNTGCSGQPVLTDTSTITILSDLGGYIEGDTLCFDATLVELEFIGTADSWSWGSQFYIGPFVGPETVDLIIYDTFYGCFEALSHEVLVYPVPPTPNVYWDGSDLYTDVANSYQWYLNTSAIFGATGQTYTPLITGDYSVLTWDENGCSMFSDQFPLAVNSVLSGSNVFDVMLYQNPDNNSIIIDFIDQQDNVMIELINPAGQMVYSNKFQNTNKVELHLEQYSAGVYFIAITSKGNTMNKKILIY